MIADIVTRLQATVPALKLVGGAALFQSAAEHNPKATPAAYVIPLAEDPAPNHMGNVLIQRVTLRVGVILVTRNLADATGAAASQDMGLMRKLVKAQLYGWQPSSELDPLERGRSGLLAFRDGHMWWQDIYVTSTLDKSTL